MKEGKRKRTKKEMRGGREEGRKGRREGQKDGGMGGEREDSSTYEKINHPNFLDLGPDLIPAQHSAKLLESIVLPIN